MPPAGLAQGGDSILTAMGCSVYMERFDEAGQLLDPLEVSGTHLLRIRQREVSGVSQGRPAMRANEEQAGSRKLPILSQALLRLQCSFVGWKGRHDLEKGRREKFKLYLTIFLDCETTVVI